MTIMSQLLTKREQAEMRRRSFRSVAVSILAIPPAMVVAWAVLLGLLASLAGLPGTEFALNFIREVAGPVVVIQAKMLMLVGTVGALCFVAGRYRIEALVLYVADKLNAGMSGLASFRALMWAGGKSPDLAIQRSKTSLYVLLPETPSREQRSYSALVRS